MLKVGSSILANLKRAPVSVNGRASVLESSETSNRPQESSTMSKRESASATHYVCLDIMQLWAIPLEYKTPVHNLLGVKVFTREVFVVCMDRQSVFQAEYF